jgi:hypothetical protein
MIRRCNASVRGKRLHGDEVTGKDDASRTPLGRVAKDGRGPGSTKSGNRNTNIFIGKCSAETPGNGKRLN